MLSDFSPLVVQYPVDRVQAVYGVGSVDHFIINARSGTVLEKKMFKESVEHRRVVVPAASFYVLGLFSLIKSSMPEVSKNRIFAREQSMGE